MPRVLSQVGDRLAVKRDMCVKRTVFLTRDFRSCFTSINDRWLFEDLFDK